MNKLHAYDNSIWLADGERFKRFITAAIVKPCPSAEQVRQRHREWMQMAKELPEQAIAARGIGGLDESAGAPRSIRTVKGKVGVIPIYGPVDQRMSGELDKAGGTPLDFVSAALDSLLGNASIGAIVLRFDSPGGSIAGVQELADKIYEARSIKPIYAIADSLAASAALWLASAASMVISTPGGGGATVGSVGVYVMHVDESAAMEQDGVKVTMVSAGKYKTEFSPYGPMSDEARSHAQDRVDKIHDQFIAVLKRNRETSLENVRSNYGQGRVLSAEQALKVGMIDRVMTFAELIGRLTGGAGEHVSRGPSADLLRLRHEQRKRLEEK